MSSIQYRVNSSTVIKIISALDTQYASTRNVNNNKTERVPLRCMFLQEKIDSAMQLCEFADQLKHKIETKRISEFGALKRFTRCYQEVVHYSRKFHSIRYIHGDISDGNILYGTKMSVEVKLINSTFGKTYIYELVNTSKSAPPRCYIIDFGTSKSKRILTSNNSIEKIYPTLLSSHPFLFKCFIYPEGRLAWKHELAHDIKLNLSIDTMDNVLWNSAISFEKYAIATSFLLALERTNIFDVVFDKVAYISQIEYFWERAQKFNLIHQLPKFGTQRQLILFENSRMIQQVNNRTIDCLFKTVQGADKNVSEKSMRMILSMKESICWYPSDYDFSLNKFLNIQPRNVTNPVVLGHPV